MEVMVSLIILVIVMVLTLSLIFRMQSFATRQASVQAPRQTARRAIDYLSFYVQGASDLNPSAGNPNALVTFFQDGNSNVRQTSYNNLTAAQSALGDPGTDIVSLAIPTSPLKIPIVNWPGNQHAADMYFNFSAGCSGPNAGDPENMRQFQAVTGALGSPLHSPVLTLVDSTATWVYYQITGYQGSDCSAVGGTNAVIHVVANPGRSDMVNPPGGQPTLTPPIFLMAGIRYVSFRILNGNLQQKQDLFDPATDNPGTAFYTVLEDVEDLQIAYLYGAAPDAGNPNVYFYNTSGASIPATIGGVATGGVPPQAGPAGVPTSWDATRMSGIRFSVSARSKPLGLGSKQLSEQTKATANNFRPGAEDRAAGAIDGFAHNRITSTLMFRNRILGS